MTLASFVRNAGEKPRNVAVGQPFSQGFLLLSVVLVLFGGVAFVSQSQLRSESSRATDALPAMAAVAHRQADTIRLLLSKARKNRPSTFNYTLQREANAMYTDILDFVSTYNPRPGNAGLNLSDPALLRADYDVWHPVLPSPLLYGYGDKPAFKYPEDLHPGKKEGIHLFSWELVSYMPRAYILPGLLASEDAEEIIRLARPTMKRSEVAEFKKSPQEQVDAEQQSEMEKEEKKESIDNVRTSQGTWLNDNEAVVKRLKKKIQQITGFAPDQQEQVQVLKYEKGQMYESHHDFFDPKLYGEMDSNRAATMYVFLTEVSAGGEFSLPRANGAPDPSDFKRCNNGLVVVPKVGSAVLFYGMRPDMHLDAYSLHTGCPVDEGVKWGAVVWIRQEGRAVSSFSED